MDTSKLLQELLSEYVVNTLIYIQTVSDFCDQKQNWTFQREKELENMKDIKDREDKISPKFDHIKNSKNKAKAFAQCLKKGTKKLISGDSMYQELEKELGAVLKDTLCGLKKLDSFLDAVEKLAVTSLFVFTGGNLFPNAVSPESVRSVITAARLASPLLIHFKRNAETFFLPLLSNLDVFIFQLDKYIRITERICERMEKRVLWSGNICRWTKGDPLEVSLNMTLRQNTMKKMLDHLNQLSKIRMDQNISMTYIFHKHALHFIGIFSQCRFRMEQFLSDLEENAVQLDRMKMGSSISSVAGSSIGVAGGVLSIAGLALAPVTAGTSLTLTLTGVALGLTSGVSGVVTGITEAAVNRHHGKTAQNIFQRYMDDVGRILDCLEQASREEHVKGPGVVDKFLTVTLMASTGKVAKNIDCLVDAASALKVLKTDKVIATATKVGFQEAESARNIPTFAADLPDIGKLAKGTPLVLSNSARAGFITLNALFIGLDILFICKDSVSLAKGTKSEVSQLIRSRAALWKSELEAWKKIHDSLCIGIWKFRKSQIVLEQTFFPSINYCKLQ